MNEMTKNLKPNTSLMIIFIACLSVALAACQIFQPSFGTEITNRATVSNGRLTLELEFMDRVQLASGETKEWDVTYQKPFIEAAEQWLRAIDGVDGKENHTIVIQITVGSLSRANGMAGPSADELIGDFTIPTRGELIIGNHTYVPGFDQVEFHANILHEIGHIIGIGSYTEAYTTRDNETQGNVFRGAKSNHGARNYNEIYGTSVDFVPMSDDGGHLYDYVLQEDKERQLENGSLLPPMTKEFMANGHVFGAVTLGVLDDIGYEIDYSAAERYTP